ncbi:MAG: hypothetical protein ACE3JU_15320 [Paenibacillus sp.]
MCKPNAIARYRGESAEIDSTDQETTTRAEKTANVQPYMHLYQSDQP